MREAGGFGITYLADDGSLGRRVAIKELLPNDIATRLDGSTRRWWRKRRARRKTWRGTLTASDGRIRRTSETTGVTAVVTYQFKTGTQLLTVDPLGPATWRKVRAPLPPRTEEEPRTSENRDEPPKERTHDEPRPKSRPQPPADIRREIQKRVPLRIPF